MAIKVNIENEKLKKLMERVEEFILEEGDVEKILQRIWRMRATRKEKIQLTYLLGVAVGKSLVNENDIVSYVR